MMRLFINALGASAGGGITYIRNVVGQLSRRSDVQATVALSQELKGHLDHTGSVTLLECDFTRGSAGRFVDEQVSLPKLIQQHRADIALSAGNFALWSSPVPQILLSRNSLYVSPDYFRDLQHRHEYCRWLDTKIKARIAAASIRRAEVTVAPSEAFAADLQHWVGPRHAHKIVSIHHGFDAAAFHNSRPAPPELAAQLENPRRVLRLLLVSNYTYYRNFETLVRAMPLIQERLRPRQVELVLTCKFGDAPNPGSYRANSTALLRDQLNLGPSIIELGSVPYELLHHVYRAGDIYVTPAYTETFAHPLVEAMSSSLPVVASDLPVHREICGQAAHYFPRFSEESLATEVIKLAEDDGARASMSHAGLARSKDFSWARHLDELLALAAKIRPQ